MEHHQSHLATFDPFLLLHDDNEQDEGQVDAFEINL
jgi:hypothetical protein